MLSEANDWTVLADLDKQLKFPSEIALTRLRPDLVLFSRASKRVIWWELTVPSEERIAASHELKLDRYTSLQAEIQANEWSCFNFAVEVGARGVVAASLEVAAKKIGLIEKSFAASKVSLKLVPFDATTIETRSIAGLPGALNCD